MNSARYLNVDCILRSKEGLSDFLSELKDDVFVLWDKPSNDGGFIGFETNLTNTGGPEEDIVEFVRMFSTPVLQKKLISCYEKAFDIGFESGDSGDPVDVTISSDTMRKITQLGFTIRIRVYPVPPEIDS